jgi:hypothetical protein
VNRVAAAAAAALALTVAGSQAHANASGPKPWTISWAGGAHGQHRYGWTIHEKGRWCLHPRRVHARRLCATENGGRSWHAILDLGVTKTRDFFGVVRQDLFRSAAAIERVRRTSKRRGYVAFGPIGEHTAWKKARLTTSSDGRRWCLTVDWSYLYGLYPQYACGTDHIAPAGSPTPAVTKNGSGAVLCVGWDPVPNRDHVSYGVYVGATPGFTPGPDTLKDVDPLGDPADTLAGECRALLGRIFIDYFAAPLPGQTVYVKIVARDADGAAPASAGSGGAGIAGAA